MGRGLCASLRFSGLESKPSAVGLLQLVVRPHSPARPRERYSADLLPRTLSKVHPGSAQPDVQASSFNVLHLEQQIRGAATHLQCPEQQSPEDPNCILPPQRGTILLLLCQQEASDLPQLWRGRAGFQERKKTKTRGYQDAMEGASCKKPAQPAPPRSSSGRGLGWPASVLASQSRKDLKCSHARARELPVVPAPLWSQCSLGMHNQQVSALRWELEVFTPPAQHLTRQESLVTRC